MARLLPCPSCGRHVRASERDCPFCGHAGLSTAAPSRLQAVLLGLCLAGCTSASKGEDAKAKPGDDGAEVEQQPEPEPPTTAVAPEPDPIEPDPGVNDTHIAPEPEFAEGTDTGAEITDPPPEATKEAKQKTKYGGPRIDPDDRIEPRPKKKYGAPPPEPRPKKKYGAAPPPDEPW